MDIVDGRYWSQSFSLFSIGLVSAVVLATLLVAIFLARKHANAAKRARIALEKKVGLSVGEALVMGIVQTDDQAPAIRVEIHQLGAEIRGKNGYSHTWTEFDRKQTTRPFRLLIPGGTHVYVEPGSDVFLVDDLELFERRERDFRVMHAELTHGESVTIEGVLERVMRTSNDGEGDYRGQQQVWLLRPPNTGKMLVSTEPLPQRHEKRATFWSRTAAVLAVFFALTHVLLIANGFWPLMMSHECCTLQVESHRQWTTRSRNTTTQHTSIIGAIAGSCAAGEETSTPVGTLIQEEVDGDYPNGARVPFQVQRGNPGVFRFGSGVGLDGPEWWALVIASIALFALGYFSLRASLPWYETKLKQSYPGRLE